MNTFIKRIIAAVCTITVMLCTVGCGSSDIDYVAKQLGVVDEVNALLYSGDCWIACAGEKALVLYINGDASSLKTIAADKKGNITVDDLSGTWSLDATNFTIFSDSEEASGEFGWDVIQEAEITCISLKGEGIDADFYLTQVADVDAAVELAKSYIVHRADAPVAEEIEETEDISEVLTEYKGISIVEAFIRAGMEPSLKNRMIFAKMAGIDDYRGTAEQNLFLIEYMGGKLK